MSINSILFYRTKQILKIHRHWIYFLFIGLTVSLMITNPTEAIPSDKFYEEELSYSVEVHRFSTQANYDHIGGSFESLGDNKQYSLINLSNQFGYGLNSQWQIRGTFDFGIANSTGATESRSNSAPTDIGVGLNGRYKFSWIYFLPKFLFKYPFSRVTPNTDEVMTGEGAIEVLAGSYAKTKLLGLHWFGFVGINYRDEGRSVLLPWQVGAEIKWRPFSLGVEMDAFTSLTDDSELENSSKSTITQRVNGSSYQFYSPNPERMSVNVWGDYKFSRWTFLRFGAGHSINGKNSAHGLSLFTRLIWNFTAEGRVRKNSRTKNERKILDDFESISQDYEQELFEDEKPKRKKRKKSRRRGRKKSAKELLDETEKALDKSN